MQHLKWTLGSVDTTKATLAFVTNYQLWRSQGQSPCPHPKNNSFHFNIEIENPTIEIENPAIDLIFGLV